MKKQKITSAKGGKDKSGKNISKSGTTPNITPLSLDTPNFTFSPENVSVTATHSDDVKFIHKFPNNDEDHFISIARDSELREWSLYNTEEEIEMSSCSLERPADSFLFNIGHHFYQPKKNNSNQSNVKISEVLCFNNVIVNGYEDGLILTWSQKKNDNLAEEESFNKEVINSDALDLINHLNNITPANKKKYINTYSLDFILTGHTLAIVKLYFIPEKQMLISSGLDSVIKFWDMKQGVSTYQFQLDSVVSNILYYSDAKKNLIVTFICRDSFKVNINITKEPYSFVASAYPHNEINGYSLINKNYYFLGNKGNIKIFDPMLNLITEVEENDFLGDYFGIQKWKNFFVLISDDKMVKVAEINEESKNISVLFKIPISRDNLTFLKLIVDPKLTNQHPSLTNLEPNICLIGSADKNVYQINLEKEIKLYWERIKMKEEDKFSLIFNNLLRAKSAKKKKKPGTAKKSRGVSKDKPRTSSSTKKKPDTAKSKKSNVNVTTSSVKSVTSEGKEKPLSASSIRSSSAKSARSISSAKSAESHIDSGKEDLPVIKEEKNKPKVKKNKPKKAITNSKSVDPSKKKKK